MDYFLGEIKMFAGTFAPRGFSLCNGAVLPKAQQLSLSNLLGTTFGGDLLNFNLPDLVGRIPMHRGAGLGLSKIIMGDKVGVEDVTLTFKEFPSHGHNWHASAETADQKEPTGMVLGSGSARKPLYSINMDRDSLGKSMDYAGEGKAHNNMQPYCAINFIICAGGVYPSRS